jgi:mono/diheme cytochrome c family protein
MSDLRRGRGYAAALAVALFLGPIAPLSAQGLAEVGHDLALRLCAPCHAIGPAERSPIPTAPAFRRMEGRVGDFDKLIENLQGGVLAGHPEMPAFVLREHEARALVAYMRSLSGN